MEDEASAGWGEAATAQMVAASEAGERMRTTVSETVLGTRAATRPAAQTAQRAIVTERWKSGLHGARASPKLGPASRGSESHTTAVAQRPKVLLPGFIAARLAQIPFSSLIT